MRNRRFLVLASLTFAWMFGFSSPWRIEAQDNAVPSTMTSIDPYLMDRDAEITMAAARARISDRSNCQCAADADELTASVYLQTQVQPGLKLSTIFSEAISYRAEAFDNYVDRASGTADYVITGSSPDTIAVDVTVLYDGQPQRKGHKEIKDLGRVACQKGKCTPTTDASGLVYNARLWGVPPASLRKGTNWEVVIPEPWELGPAGSKQTVTVLAIDAANHSVTLQREGNGEGFFANDDKQVHLTKGGKSYVVDMNPGRSHWKGYTTFREGIVINDELLVERPVTFSSKDLGTINGTERAFILLNARPAGALLGQS